MLRRKYDDETEIPEQFRELYRQDDGGAWVLQVDGDEPEPGPAPTKAQKAKIAEMRNTNIELRKQMEAMQAQLDGLMSKTKDEEEQQLVKAGKFDELLQRRTKAMQEQHAQQMEALQKKRDRMASVFLSEQVSAGLERKKLRLRPSAKMDLLARAQSMFDTTDELDNLVPKRSELLPDGRELTVESWLEQLVSEAPHLFDGGEGGGARGAGVGGGRKKYDAQALRSDPLAFTRAAEEVNAGKAEWQ